MASSGAARILRSLLAKANRSQRSPKSQMLILTGHGRLGVCLTMHCSDRKINDQDRIDLLPKIIAKAWLKLSACVHFVYDEDEDGRDDQIEWLKLSACVHFVYDEVEDGRDDQACVI
ncbi:hypothetical protein E3N88_13523 [Mikania micrantha]|uniref:Uncharacterized protein n=1 Tax=Mikania micrantha TaxID=192012 RepID=A0A5N6PAL2_9ASTR|nr:hypothetical protein E3N88_13523 [Mikania micrantha]